MPLSLSSEGDPMTDTAPPDVNALARGYGRAVYLAAYRVLGDASQAEDVQQDVFLRLIEKSPADVDSWPAYLAAMATRQAIDRLRSRQRWRRLRPLWKAAEPVAADTAEEDAEQAERAQRLRAALARLKPQHAECFVLRHIHGLDTMAIARATGLTPNHVGVCLHRAAQMLESLLNDRARPAPEVL